MDLDTVLDAEECLAQRTSNVSAPLGRTDVSEAGGGRIERKEYRNHPRKHSPAEYRHHHPAK